MIPISQAKIKFVQSLKRKKYRLIHMAYVLEGVKACETVVSAGFQPLFSVTRRTDGMSFLDPTVIFFADEKTMKSLTTFSSTPELLCIFQLPASTDQLPADSKKPILFLDRIQDPGNLGTMIRTADWYGVQLICLSKGSVDVFNPKCLQSAMGSHINLSFISIEIDELQKKFESHLIVGLDMSGVPLNEHTCEGKSIILVIGNEGQGLSEAVINALHLKVSISGADTRKAESLNAAIALAVSLDRICLGQNLSD